MFCNKKIVFVIASLGGGGAERVLTNLANYFINNGYTIEILYSYIYNKKPVYLLDENVNIHKVPANIKIETGGFLKSKRNTYLILKHLRSKFKELKPDVIISFMDKTNIYSILSHIGLSIPLVISERTNFHFLQSNAWRLLRRIFYPFANGLVVLSGYDYNKYKFVKNKKVIQNPLVTDNLLDVRFSDKEKIILAVGRLDINKGFHKLIKIAYNLDLNDWRINIIGAGPEKDSLNMLIKKYNLEEKVFLLGRKDNIYEYYKKASIFTLTSTYEGFPNALAEAMSFGCSCVSFDCITGPSDIISNDTNGYLIKNYNEDEMKEKIQYLMDDKKLRGLFFEKSIKIREKLSIENIAKEWEEFFTKL